MKYGAKASRLIIARTLAAFLNTDGGHLVIGVLETKVAGQDDQIVRLQGTTVRLPRAFHEAAQAIGMSMVTTTVYDDYFMFIKINLKMSTSPTAYAMPMSRNVS